MQMIKKKVLLKQKCIWKVKVPKVMQIGVFFCLELGQYKNDSMDWKKFYALNLQCVFSYRIGERKIVAISKDFLKSITKSFLNCLSSSKY